MNNLTTKLKETIRHPFAWPGGYPVYVVLNDGEMLCHECTKDNYRLILDSTRKQLNDGWTLTGAEILWESEEFCGHCSKQLESTYGDEMLNCEDPTQNKKDIIGDFKESNATNRYHENVSADFEEQWFITCLDCGAQWSVNDAQKQDGEDYWDFEQLSYGDESCFEEDES